MNGENIELGADGNLTVDEFVHSMPEIFFLDSVSGNSAFNSEYTLSSGTEVADLQKGHPDNLLVRLAIVAGHI